MKKLLTSALLLLIAKDIFAQDKLYYFYTADSTLVGVKNDKEKIIIPAKFSGIRVYDTEKPIDEPTIEFWGTPSIKNKKYNKKNPRLEAGEVYSRKGKFMYYPQWFDNGTDFWEEEFRRYVEKDKIGFVNWFGKKIIRAKWDFASMFNYGYATVYTNGWERKYDDSGEHWSLVPTNSKSTSYIINKKGKKVKPMDKPNSDKDILIDGKYYPYPFVYNGFEQKLVDKVNNLKILKEISVTNPDTYRSYEIVTKPNSYRPYYELKPFDGEKKINNSDDSIWADEKGNLFHRDYFEGHFIPLKEHIKGILHGILEDQKEGYKSADYPINAKKLLDKLENEVI